MKGKNKGIRCGIPIEKIAYYVKELCKKEYDIGNTILVIKSQFCDKDIKEFAEKYYECSNDNNVRYIANLLRSIPSKDMNKYLNNKNVEHIIS